MPPSASIPVMKPQSVRSEFLLPRLESVARSGVFSNRGPQVRELEERIAEWVYVSPSRVVATSNATVGLTAAVALSSAEKWKVPAWSFPATALAPMQAGKPIEFVELNPKTWLPNTQPDPPKTGLITVIPFGGSFDSGVWAAEGDHIVDAAASLATKPDLSLLPESAAVVFSLHATKTMGGAEGGILVFGSEERAALARKWINFGFSSERESVLVGTNGKMSEYDAAVANARLDGWPVEREAWAERRKWVQNASRNLGIANHPEAMNALGPYWITVFESHSQRDAVRLSLHSIGIDSRLWWGTGLHRMEAFAEILVPEVLAVEDLSARYLGLPFFVGLSRGDLKAISEAIQTAIE